MGETPRRDGDGAVSSPEPIVLKNRIAVLTPDPIAEGAFGKVYIGKILNPVGLLAERIVWGEESPRWLGLEDISYEEPDRDLAKDRQLPVPITDPAQRKRIYQAAERLWNDYLERRKQDRARADEEYRDLLKLIDPLLHEDRIIAVKVWRSPAGADPDHEQKIILDSVRRFIKENDILRTLRHPAIVRRFGLVRDGKMGWCLLLEYIEGETLDVCQRKHPDGRMPLSRAAQLIKEIADAIHYMHGRGVVHRDLKPQNIMVRKDDSRAVIMDFGIGKWVDELGTQQFTQSGLRIGTPKYMAPEQVRADAAVGQAADVYQLATIFFELATGQPAYGDLDQGEIFRWLLDPARRHPTYLRDLLPFVSRDIEDLIEVGREKDPERRWTIEEFRVKIDRILSERRFEAPTVVPSLSRAELVQTLQETRMRKKELSWEEHLLGTRLAVADLRQRVQDAWAHLEKKAYLEAHAALEAVTKEVAALPARYDTLKLEVENLGRAFTLAKARHEAEYLLSMAEQHYASGRFLDVGAALDGANTRLAALPREGYADVHKRFKDLADRYDAQHRSFVELLTTLRRSFVDKIQERYRELSEIYGTGKTVEGGKVAELLSQLATVERNVRTVDREKVGAVAFDGMQKDLRELRIALEDLLKRTGTPA